MASDPAQEARTDVDVRERLSGELEAAVERCAIMVRSIAARHGLVGPDVDEVFQEVRIRLWKAVESGERIATLPASYIYRTATTSALDIIRKRRSLREDTLDAAATFAEAGARSHPGDELERREASALVHEAVAGLIESRRPVVRMYLAGYRQDEIAALLGWTEAKTRNLLYRGLDDLRTALTRSGLSPGAL